MTKKEPNDDTAQTARRLFLFLSFLLLYMNGITVAGIINFAINSEPFDIITAILFTMVFLGYLLGLIGVFKPLPPLHYGILIASAINLVLSLIIVIAGGSEGLLQGMISFLILYLGLRFPLNLAEGEISYNTERLLS